MRALVITVSDSRTAGVRPDLSGPAVVRALEAAGFSVPAAILVPDERDRIEAALREHAAHFVLIVTTGGTGIAVRDVTPEATAAVCERMLPGFGEKMRAEGSRETALAYLSRSTAGVCGRCLVVNLPGSPQGAVTSLRAVLDLIPHALALLSGEATGHPGDQPASHSEARAATAP
jgi:molybdopterin adenylyltransferase